MLNANYNHTGMVDELREVEQALQALDGQLHSMTVAVAVDPGGYAEVHLDEALKLFADDARKLSDKLTALRRYVQYPSPAFQKPQRDWAVAP